MKLAVSVALLLALVACSREPAPFLDMDILTIIPQAGVYRIEGIGPTVNHECVFRTTRAGLFPASTVMFFCENVMPLKLALAVEGSAVSAAVDVNGYEVASLKPAGETQIPFRSQKGLNVIVLRYKDDVDKDAVPPGREALTFTRFEILSDVVR